AGLQLAVHHAGDAGDALAVAGDVGEADAGDDPRVAHRAVVDVATRCAVTRIRVEDAGEAGQIYDRPDGFVASANFPANQSDGRLWLWHPLPNVRSQNDSLPARGRRRRGRF